jgi:hypothetical protein
MYSSASHWLSRVVRAGRLLAVVVALVGQVSSGALAQATQASEGPRATLEAAMVLCLGSNHPGKDGAPPIHHHLPGPALASAGHHLVQPAAILDGIGGLPAPPLHLAVWTGLPETRGPPARDSAAFYPTGPPHHLI